MNKINFYASAPHYVDHQFRTWHTLPEDARGVYYLDPRIARYGFQKYGIRTEIMPATGPRNGFPVLVSSYSDIVFVRRRNPKTRIVYQDHGVGFAFPTPAYNGWSGKGPSYRTDVSLMLMPNEPARLASMKGLPNTPHVTVGCPKMDWAAGMFGEFFMPEHPLVAAAFHWNGKGIIPEAGSALQNYVFTFASLSKSKDFGFVVHAHPKHADQVAGLCKNSATRFERDLQTIFMESNLLAADATSARFEYLCTGKPIIHLNTPIYRRHVRYGVGFWDYTDTGLHVWHPKELLPAIEHTLKHPDEFVDQRRKAVEDLYPYLGHAASVAANAILDFLQ